jgi:hypothetical protein
VEENMILNKPSLLAIAERWPSAFVSRTEIDRFTGGALNAKYSAWLDSQGRGIKDRVFPVRLREKFCTGEYDRLST